jgi:predicted metal-binding membrane protein
VSVDATAPAAAPGTRLHGPPPLRRVRLLRPRATLAVELLVGVAWVATIAEVITGPATPRLGVAGLPMWVGMTMAMMLPGALPAVRHVAGHSLSWRRRQAVAEWLVVNLGVWGLAGAVTLAALGAAHVDPVRALPVLLLAAAAWQLTPAKRRTLWRCHRTAPLYPRGRRATAAVGRFAVLNATGCVGSCWLLMAAMVVAPAAGRLPLMAALTVLVTTEKLTDRPRRAVRWGALALAFAVVAICISP